MERAEVSNLELFEAGLNREKADSSYVSARSNLLPSLVFQSNVARSFISPEAPLTGFSGWTSNAALVLSQSLYSNGTHWRNLEKASLERSLRETDFRLAQESLAYEVLAAYADCSLFERRIVASQRKVQLLEAQFDLVKRQFRQGLKTQRDYQILEAELERSRLSLSETIYQKDNSFRTLEKLVGLEAGTLSQNGIALWTGELVVSKKTWFHGTREFDPERESFDLKLLSISQELRKTELEESRRLYWPQLNLNAALSYGSNSWMGPSANAWADRDALETSIGLSLKWVLWDWGATSSTVQKSKADVLIAERRSFQKRIELEQDFAAVVQNIERQKKLLEVQQKIRGLERKSFVDIEKEYREGRSSYLDLLTGLDRDIQAELSFESEAFSYLKSVSLLKKYKGTLYESIRSF